jgi:hypothetical protein
MSTIQVYLEIRMMYGKFQTALAETEEKKAAKEIVDPT